MPALNVEICHVNLARGYCGGERQTELLVSGLAAHGVQQRLVAREGEPLIACLADTAGLRIVEVGGSLWGVAGKLRGASLVHVHEGRSALAAFVRRMLSGEPYIITRRVSNLPKSDLVTHRIYRDAAKIIGISNAACEILSKRYDERLEPAVINDACGELTSDPATVVELRARFKDRFVVSLISALANEKGQSYLIEVARRISTSHPQIHFLLAGSGPDESQLRAEARGLGNVTFEGFVPNVGDYLEITDVLAMPSLREGLGTTVLDALSFGVPVVASNVDGLPEIVHDGKTGILVEPRDVDALRAAIVSLYDDPDRRQSLGRQGLQIAHRFKPARMVEQYLDLYKNLLAAG